MRVGKMKFFPWLLIFGLLPFWVTCQSSSSLTITRADYQRAESFLPRHLRQKVYGEGVQPQWIKKTSSFWYRVNTRQGKTFYLVDPEKATKREVFNHERVAELLSLKMRKKFSRKELPFDSIKFINSNQIEFEVEKKVWTLNLKDYTLTSRPKEKERKEEKLKEKSPDGQWIAFARDYNLYVRSTKTGRVIKLSHRGKKFYEYATYLGWNDLIEGEDGVKPSHFFVRWSPDSKKIFTQIVDFRQGQKMYLLQSVNEGFRAKLYSYYRALPGEEKVIRYIPVIFDVTNRKEIRVDLPPIPHFIGLQASWLADSQRLHARVFDRGYKGVSIYEIEAATGRVRQVARDENPTMVETALSHYRFLPRKELLLLTSERDGWNHLYLYEWSTGRLLRQLTHGEYVVLNIIHVDEAAETIYFTAVGREKGEDPYLVHLYRVNLDGSGLLNLTPEPAYHEIFLSPDKKYFVDRFSRVDFPTRTVVRRLKDGKIILKLETTDIKDLLSLGWQFPEPFVVKAADGQTDIYGLLWRPTNFNPHRKYPVIEAVYTGPQAVATPKTFARALYHSQTALAELQFICVTIDGRGTARRSKKFHDFSYHNLGGGCLDHVTALQQLAEKYNYLDLERVGLYGHSAGGYDTVRAMLNWPDFYKVGVASSGNHDHRLAKAWWPEQYMGYPVGPYYEEQSNITSAGRLKGKLLLVHGEMDENVNPVATLRLVDALIKQNKDFDLLILPNTHHGYRDVYGDYFTRKRWDYFVRHLHGVEPPAYSLFPLKKK
ncbi:MAG: DPP IV N-terminal domain-containing protein [Candidatus Aminicenantes bacterium]|nr:DPP IV N-terminal domain-containing protein [Candidatus Aminicenantes bacterium]